MVSCCALFNEDRHSADYMLDPLRYCVSRLQDISRSSPDCKSLALRTLEIILLVIATVITFLIALIAIARKTHKPADYFTPREALLKEHQLWGASLQAARDAPKICDLRSGVIYINPTRYCQQYIYWEPGPNDYYGYSEDVFPEPCTTWIGKIKITSQGVEGGLMFDINETTRKNNAPLTESEVRNLAKNATSISYAPYLGIIVARINGEMRYMTPPNQVWQPIPSKKTWIPTGGRIHPDGSVDGETLQNIVVS